MHWGYSTNWYNNNNNSDNTPFYSYVVHWDIQPTEHNNNNSDNTPFDNYVVHGGYTTNVAQ